MFWFSLTDWKLRLLCLKAPLLGGTSSFVIGESF